FYALLRHPVSALFPYTTLFRSPAMIVGFLDKCRHVPSITRAYFREVSEGHHRFVGQLAATDHVQIVEPPKRVRREDWVEPFYQRDRKSTRLNSSHVKISYAVFC